MTILRPLACLLALAGLVAAQEKPPAIQQVEIGPERSFQVNGKPFFPIMAWLQDAANFDAVRACGMNTTAGYWSGSGGTKDVTEYLALVEQAGLYGVMPFDPRLKGHPALVGYIHGDEPDLPHQVNDADVVPSSQLRVNSQTPLWKLVDGVTHSWSVLDPLEGAAVTVRLKSPASAARLVLWPTVSQGLALPKEVVFEADGQEVARGLVEARKGPHEFKLDRPATFRELRVQVCSTYPGDQAWGSLGEIEAYDAAGKNVILSPPRQEPRALPAEVEREYRQIKAADPSRPVFMTLTGNFHPHFEKYAQERREALYPAYLRAADVVGYDIYPIYGWNKPEWIHLVQEATGQLVEMAAPRPVYVWIETSKGSQWTGPLEKQKDVTGTHIRAEVWMSLCRGATAIGYFTHVWKPSYHQFGVPEENRRALRAINNQITRLAPALLAPPAKRAARIAGADEVKLDLMARAWEDDLYLFAVNYDERSRATQATITVAGLPAGTTVEVIDEDRTLASAAGSFADQFAPLAVHLYRIKGLGR